MAVMILLEDTPEVANVFRAIRSMMEMPPTEASVSDLIIEMWGTLAAVYGCQVPQVTDLPPGAEAVARELMMQCLQTPLAC